jgi:hypothetical protein
MTPTRRRALRIRWKSLIPLVGVLGSWLASPEVLHFVSDRWSHWLLLVSSLSAVLTPALLTLYSHADAPIQSGQQIPTRDVRPPAPAGVELRDR